MDSIIRFAGFVFEHNPETLKITAGSTLASADVLGSSRALSHSGVKNRVISGEGFITGEDCLFRFSRMLRLLSREESCLLCLPDIRPFFAFFRSLRLSCDPTPNLVRYYFEFEEDALKGKKPRKPNRFFISRGEDLWDISRIFNLSVEELVNLNPQIKRPNEIEIGEAVRIC